MRIAEFIAYVKSLVPYTYYAYNFPATAADDCILAIIGGGMATEETGVLRPSAQLLVRGKDLASTEQKAYELFNALKYRRDFMIGTSSVVELFAAQSAPLYTGADDASRHIFSINLMATIRP